MTDQRQPSIRRLLVLGFILILTMRLIMVFTMGLMPQDAYYYFYSTQPALSYFDHPPGVAVHLWIFTKFLGTHPWSLKLADFIVMCMTLGMFYVLARKFLSTERSLWALCIFGGTLIMTDVSIVTTPDVPLLLLWTISLLAIHKAIHSMRLWHWGLAGVLAGLAFDAKYTALYLPVALAAFIFLKGNLRKALITHFPLYLIGFAMAAFPVILWNVQNDMTSLQFQTGNRFASILEFNVRPRYFAGMVGHQALMLLPVLAVTTVIISWKYIRRMIARRMPDQDSLFLLIFSVPLILGFVMISWVYWVKINWMLPAYIGMTILTMRFLKTRHMRWQQYFAVVANFLLLVQIVFYPIPIQSDDTYWGWPELTAEVKALHLQYPNHFIFASDGYKTTAVLDYYLEDRVYAGNVIGKPALQYSVADSDLGHLAGRNALFLDSENMASHFQDAYTPPPELSMHFARINLLPKINLKDGRGRTLRQFAVVECMDYHPVPADR